MPIEIKELVIRAVVDERTPRAAAPSGAAQRSETELIEECVKRVLEILERKRER
jgi:hypothetical protein